MPESHCAITALECRKQNVCHSERLALSDATHAHINTVARPTRANQAENLAIACLHPLCQSTLIQQGDSFPCTKYLMPDCEASGVTSSTSAKLGDLLLGVFSAQVCQNQLAITSWSNNALQQSILRPDCLSKYGRNVRPEICISAGPQAGKVV